MTTVTTRWWWVRHAPVDNPDRRLYGQDDLEADVSDGAAVEALAAALPDAAVWVASHLRRAAQTAEAVRAARVRLGRDAPAPAAPRRELAEQDFGAWQGMTVHELRAHLGPGFERFWRSPADAVPPGGESFADVIARVARTVERLNAEHAGRDIVAFAHGGSIRAALAHALDLAPEAALSFQIRNLSLTRIDHIVPGDDAPSGTVRPWRVGTVNLTAEGAPL